MTFDLATTGWIVNQYLRVSKFQGRERSPDDQNDDHARTREARGWKLGKTYRDIGSASRHARKARDDFERMLRDLETGQFGAQALQLWEPSRGSRRESEWIRLVELCEEQSVYIWVETHHRLYDCANGRDRRSLLEDAIDSAYETTKLSDRSRRGVAAAAVEGMPHGRVRYGYKRIYHELTGKLVAEVLEPDEAPIVKELFERWVREPLYSIAKDFEKRGIEKRSGGPFSPAHLRSMIVNPAYAGIRVHDPERSNSAFKITNNAKFTKAKWPAIISMDLWIKAQQKVLRQSQAANRGRRPGAAKYLLSMMIRCDKCSSPMIVNPGKTGKKGYACRARGCVRINMEELDRFVERLILRWLSDPEQYSALAHRGDDADSELADVRRNLDAARTELAELASQVANGALSVSFAATVEPGIQRRIKELEKRELELATPSALVSLITPGVDVEARWDAAPIGTKREIVRLLLSPEVLGELRVVRIGPGRRVVPVQDRIKWRRVPAAA